MGVENLKFDEIISYLEECHFYALTQYITDCHSDYDIDLDTIDKSEIYDYLGFDKEFIKNLHLMFLEKSELMNEYKDIWDQILRMKFK